MSKATQGGCDAQAQSATPRVEGIHVLRHPTSCLSGRSVHRKSYQPLKL